MRPGAVTALGLLACVMVPVFAVRGPGGLLLAALMVVVAALADTVDGALAILTDHTTRLGYVYDSVVDRLGEVIWLVAFWLIGVPAYAVVIAGHADLDARIRPVPGKRGRDDRDRRRRRSASGPPGSSLAIVGLGLAGLVSLGNPDLGSGVATFAVAAWIVLSLIGFLQLFATVHRVLGGPEVATVVGCRRPNVPRNWRAASGASPRRCALRAVIPVRVTPIAPGSASTPRSAGAPVTTPQSASPVIQRAACPASGAGAVGRGVRGDGSRGGRGRSRRPVRSRPESLGDDELLREIAELGELPGSSVIYTSTGTGDDDQHGRHEL